MSWITSDRVSFNTKYVMYIDIIKVPKYKENHVREKRLFRRTKVEREHVGDSFTLELVLINGSHLSKRDIPTFEEAIALRDAIISTSDGTLVSMGDLVKKEEAS